ncbi:hypothetical protein MMC10_008838 [Thelotrema lepadinum]|nr:hypothetical protein [Thelotrema lepadinum]
MALTGPSYQIGVDVPSLTQLVVNLGNAGMKKLASSGVDIHTMACMLKVAELVPACHEFRQDLTNIRKKQREKQIWLYAVVELGTATNFPVDLLLKTRAGENVMALICSLLPMLPEALCIEALEAIFDLQQAVPEDVPSISQLRNLCNVVKNFTLDMDIKNRIINYAVLFESLLSGTGQSSRQVESLIYNSFPSPINLAQIILSVRDMLTQREDSVLIWPGLKGAAWLAVYAVCMLNLPTCAVGLNGEVPINSAYISARVVLDLTDNTDTVRTFRRASASDIYKLFDISHASECTREADIDYYASALDASRTWQVDCSSDSDVTYLSLHIGKLETSCYNYLSDIIAVTALRTLHSMTIIEWSGGSQKFPMLSKRFLPAESFYRSTSIRLLKTLVLLGFRSLSIDKYTKMTFDWVLTDREKDRDFSRNDDDLLLCFSATNWKSTFPGLAAEDPSMPEMLVNICKKTVALAIALATTDWIDSWRRLPLWVIKQGYVGKVEDALDFQASNSSKQRWYLRLDMLLIKTLGLEMNRAQKIRDKDAVAFQYLDITFLRTCVDYRDCSWADFIFYRLIPGSIRSEDTCFKYILSDYALHQPLHNESVLGLEKSDGAPSNANSEPLKVLQPLVRPKIQALTLATARSINLRLQCFLQSQYKGTINCLNIFHLLRDRFVSLPCNHSYSQPCHFPFSQLESEDTQVQWQWQSDGEKAFYVRNFDNYSDTKTIRFEAWFPPSQDCPETQFALSAVREKPMESLVTRTAFRKETCIRCMLSQIAERIGTLNFNGLEHEISPRNVFRILIISLDTKEAAKMKTVNAMEID